MNRPCEPVLPGQIVDKRTKAHPLYYARDLDAAATGRHSKMIL